MARIIDKPSKKTASIVVHSMTGEDVISISRMATGDQNFVFAVKTAKSVNVAWAKHSAAQEIKPCHITLAIQK